MKAAIQVLLLWLTLTPVWCASLEPDVYSALLRHCEGLDNSFRCARAIEGTQAKGPDRTRFRRTGAVLRVSTAKVAITFRDKYTEGDDSIHFSYLAYLPSLQVHVLHLQYWEGNVYMVVHDHSGAAVKVDGFPNAASESRHFVSISSAGEAGYDPNSVEVWRVGRRSVTSEFRYVPASRSWSPESAEWLNAASVKLGGLCAPGSAEPKPCFALLEKSNDQWRVKHDR